MRISKNILKPLITEKNYALVSKNIYVFEVTRESNKYEIGKEVADLYKVDVLEVKTNLLPGKKRRILKTRNHMKSEKKKKAYVKLKAGQKIDLIAQE